MSAPKLSKVQAKGQVTIPIEIRQTLGLQQGDVVAFVETDRGVLISPQEVVAIEALQKIGEALEKRGVSLEQMIASGRDVRGELLEEEYGLKAEDE